MPTPSPSADPPPNRPAAPAAPSHAPTPEPRGDGAAGAGGAQDATLVDALDEGFALCEMLPDDRGALTDFRYLAVNPAFETLTGLSAAATVGRRVRELRPILEGAYDDWVATYARVVETGTPVRFERHFAPLGRWLSVYAFPRSGRRFAAFFSDVTARVQAEAALRASEARQAFLLALSDALRPLADPVEIQATAARLVGAHLRVGCCGYGETDPTGEFFTVARDWTDGRMASLTGRRRLRDFGDEVIREYEAGRTVRLEDPLAAPQARGKDAAYVAGDGIQAGIGVPLRKHGRFVAAFYVQSTEPRRWADAEVALVEETAERTWAAVERARAEAALRESEARLAAVFEALPVGIGVVDPAGQAVLANRALHAWLPTGYMPSRDAARVGRWQAWRPDGTRIEPQDFPGARALRGERTVPGLEMLYTGDDHRARWTQVAAVPVRDEDGRVTGAVTMIGDVDAPKRTAEALRASEARARALVATLPGAAVFVFDHDLRYQLAEGEAFRAAGFTPEAFVGRTVDAVLGPPLAAEYARRIRPVLAGEPFEWEHAAHGRVFLSRGVPLRGGRVGGSGATGAGNRAGDGLQEPVAAALVVSVDVTARREAEAARRASEARYRTLVANVPDYAIFLLDAEGRVTEWPEGAQRVKGYAPAEVLGRHVSLFYTPEERATGAAEQELAEAARTGRAEREQWRVRKDGTRFWVNEVMTAVTDGDGRLVGFTKISRDLTERHRAHAAAEQAQLQAARDDLRRALAQAEEAERQRLARELHDQLGQELTAFRLGLDDAARLAAEHVPPDAPLLGRIGQLGALAQRMTAGARYVALELRPPELDDVGLESALETYAAEWAARYGIAAEVAVTGLRGRALPPDVTSTLYRIAQEALTNVAKHAGATQVSVIVEQPDGEVRLIVEDDGRGFDVEATDARVRRERRLGLAGMRERAALVGGTVAVESSPGAGTTVYVRLPVDHPLDPSGIDPGSAAA